MTEPNSSKHWDSLISDLGAKPPAEEESQRQPDPQQPQPARTKKPAATHRPQPAADWNLIAGDLGVTPASQPIEPPQEIVESSVAPAEALRRVSVTPERGEESPNFFDEQFDLEEPFNLLESADESDAAPKAEEPAEKRPRKRRRRRRPAKGSEDRKTSEPAPGNDSDRETAAKGVETGDKPASSEQRRSKRSRPRRGKKRRSGDEQKPAEPRDESDSHDDFDVEETADERGGEQSVRAGFRGIPTWGETVGLVIEKNLESRAKRPGGAPRSRGKKRRS